MITCCGPSMEDREVKEKYYVSLAASGERLAYNSSSDEIYKPVFFKPESTEGATSIRFEKNAWDTNLWLSQEPINSKAQCMHIGAGSQLFMGDCEREEFEAVLFLYDPQTEKIFSATQASMGLVKGPNGEAMMLDNKDSKYTLIESK